MHELSVEQIFDLPDRELDGLVAESVALGFGLLCRLVADWDSGANRFDRPGESLFRARHAGRVVGVCGLNVDPYSHTPGVGRLRHLYVAAARRRQGVGRALVHRIVAEAAKSFSTLTLRTRSAEAAAFYERVGFAPTDQRPASTHFRDLRLLSARVH
jgi:GNAT superfamily N-acetyltransferase